MCVCMGPGDVSSSPPGRLCCWQPQTGLAQRLVIACVGPCSRGAGWRSTGAGLAEVTPRAAEILPTSCAPWEVRSWTLRADPRRWPLLSPAQAGNPLVLTGANVCYSLRHGGPTVEHSGWSHVSLAIERPWASCFDSPSWEVTL